jgi:hypothetical protein
MGPGSLPHARSALGNVHRDFHAEPEISGLRCFPFHDEAPVMDGLTMQHLRPVTNPADHESGLMIFISGAERLVRGWKAPLLPSSP